MNPHEIPSDYFWKNIFILTIGTIAIRYSIIAISSKIVISGRTKQIFSFIPAAILPALTVPMVFFAKGEVVWLHGKERLAVLIFATVVCYLTRSTLATIVFGLAGLYLLKM